MKKIISLIGFMFILNQSYAQKYSSWQSPQILFKKTLSTNYYTRINGKKETVYAYDGKYCWIETHKNKPLLWRRVYFTNESLLMKK